MLEASWKMLKMDDFGENGKPIALLFGESWVFLGTFLFLVGVEES